MRQSPAPAQDGNAEDGAEVFKKCRACHDVGPGAKNKVGPLLNDIVGRPAGTIEGFNYSDANKDAGAKGLVWTEDVLFKYLETPLSFMPGTKMAFAGLQGRAGPQGRDRLPEDVREVSDRRPTRDAAAASSAPLAADATVEAALQLRLAALAVVGGTCSRRRTPPSRHRPAGVLRVDARTAPASAAQHCAEAAIECQQCGNVSTEVSCGVSQRALLAE